MTQDHTKSCHKFHPFRFMRVIHRIRGSSYELIAVCVFLKINRFLELRRLIFNLFHWMIVDEKNSFLKRSSLCKIGGKWVTFLVLCNESLTGIKLKRNWGCWFFNMLQSKQIFLHQHLSWTNSHLILNKLFLSMYP